MREYVLSTRFATIGQTDVLIAGSNQGRINIWKTLDFPGKKQEKIQPIKSIAGSSGSVYALDVLDNQYLVVGCDQDILIYDLNNPMPSPIELKLNTAESSLGSRSCTPETNALVCDPLSKQIVSGGGDGRLYIWDFQTSQPVTTIDAHSDMIHTLKCFNSFNGIVTGSEDGTVRIWDKRTQHQIRTLYPVLGTSIPSTKTTSTEYDAFVSCVDIDASEEWILCGGGLPVLSLWHMSSGKLAKPMSCTQSISGCIFGQYRQIYSVGWNQNTIDQWRFDGLHVGTGTTHSAPMYSICQQSQRDHPLLCASGSSSVLNVYTDPLLPGLQLDFCQ